MNTNEESQARSLGEIVRGLTEDISTLVRSEIALAKLELKHTAAGIGTVGAMFAAALFCALFALAFLLVTAVLALSLVIPPWLSSLIVAVLLIIVAVVLVTMGRKRIQGIDFLPNATVRSVKGDVDSIKGDLSRLKRETS